MSKSILQDDKVCYICGTTASIEEHHIFGASNRKKSEKYVLKVYLCHKQHNENVPGDPGVHHSKVLNIWLKQIGQRAFIESYPGKDFLAEFGRNYL